MPLSLHRGYLRLKVVFPLPSRRLLLFNQLLLHCQSVTFHLPTCSIKQIKQSVSSFPIRLLPISNLQYSHFQSVLYSFPIRLLFISNPCPSNFQSAAFRFQLAASVQPMRLLPIFNSSPELIVWYNWKRGHVRQQRDRDSLYLLVMTAFTISVS